MSNVSRDVDTEVALQRSPEPVPALQLTGVSKRYPGVVALDSVDFAVAFGEIRALLGKNGAGKSTMMRIACGHERPDSGELRVAGETVKFNGPLDARRLGIEIVHQELNLVPYVTVAEAMSIGRWPRRAGRIDRAAMRTSAREALARLGVTIDVDAEIHQLTAAQQQLVEIAKALAREPKVLLLDEPTSSLAHTEVGRLLGVVRRIAADGVAVIYVSHRLAEIAEIADSLTVLRDGRSVATAPVGTMTSHDIVHAMLGDEAAVPAGVDAGSEDRVASGGVALDVAAVADGRLLENVSFTLHAGEVLGIAGLLGSGRTELLRIIAGFERPSDGRITLGDGRPAPNSVAAMIARGVALCPEDRRLQGLVPALGVDENIALGRWRCLSRFRTVSWGAVRRLATETIARLSIKTPSPGTPVSVLSGGNKQKVVIGRWLDVASNVMLLDEPTRGVDVAGKGQIYEAIRSLAANRTGVIVVTSELEELLLCCDNIIVLRGGVASEKLSRRDLTVARLVDLTNGVAA